MKKNVEKVKKIENKFFKKIIFKILEIIIIICVTYNIIFFMSTSITQKEYFSVFGISLFTMENDLMEEELKQNDLIIVKDIEKIQEDLKVNDNIVYDKNGQIKINKIIKINQDNGITEYITKGNKNYHPNNEPVKKEQIIGKVCFKIPVLGILINILQSKITTIFLVMILVIRLFYNKYKYNQKIERKRKKLKNQNISN